MVVLLVVLIIRDREQEDELVVHFENPRISPEFVAGNLETVEAFGAEHGGIPLNDMQSVPRSFSTTVTYCGENASYVDGQCVIDEQLHLRSDLCPLLENQQIVSPFSGCGGDTSQLKPNRGRYTMDWRRLSLLLACLLGTVVPTGAATNQTAMPAGNLTDVAY